MKAPKPSKKFHSSSDKTGKGDYYGTGIKNKIGRIIDVTGFEPVKNSKMGKSPKSLA